MLPNIKATLIYCPKKIVVFTQRRVACWKRVFAIFNVQESSLLNEKYLTELKFTQTVNTVENDDRVVPNLHVHTYI